MKRQFLLLLSLLAVMMHASLVYAQKVTDLFISSTDVNGNSYRIIDPGVSNPATDPDSIIMGTYGSTLLLIYFQNAYKIDDKTTVELRYDGVAAYLGLPDTVVVYKKDIIFDTFLMEVKGGWNFPESMNGGIVSISARIKDSNDNFTAGTNMMGGNSNVYGLFRPFFTLDYNPVTPLYDGKLIVNYTGLPGHENATREIQGKPFTRDNINKSFTKSEIYNLTENDTIIVEINLPQTYYSNGNFLSNPTNVKYKIPVSGIIRDETENPTPGLQRAVTVPAIPNAIVSREQGIYYISSTSNFVFTIQPTGTNTGRVPVVTTNRTNIPDSEGVIIEDNGDGSYTVTILHVQQSITISVDFATGNNIIDNGNKVWADKDILYIQTEANRIVNIYNTAGTLVKSVHASAGETTSTTLPAGFYIVKPDNDKSYKVILR